MRKILFVFILFLFGCKDANIAEPEKTLTGRYQNVEYSMILLLVQDGNILKGELEWMGFATELSGVYDEVNQQIILSGNYFGSANITFDLFVGADNKLAGGFNFNGQGTTAISFDYMNKLSLEKQIRLLAEYNRRSFEFGTKTASSRHEIDEIVINGVRYRNCTRKEIIDIMRGNNCQVTEPSGR